MSQRYTRAARVFHWTIALVAALQIALGLATEWLARGTSRAVLDIHVQVGLLVLALMVLRLLWRLAHPPPPFPPSLAPLHRMGARTLHWSLYLLMLVLPVSGYLLWMWIGVEVRFLGGPAIPIPNMAGSDEFWRSLAGYTHEYAFYALAALLALHIGAALMHEWRGPFRPIRDRMI